MASERHFAYKGILFPAAFYTEEVIRYVENEFQLLDNDIITVTYPRSGTHWMGEILGLIRNDGNPTWVRSSLLMERSPWIETTEGLRNALKYPPPRLLTTHLPVQLFPKSFLQSKAKVIYVVRNPKDVFTSRYHFTNANTARQFLVNMEPYLLEFLSGHVYFGSWFDHVKGWMELKDRPNVFFISYEELHQDLRGSVERVCRFLGKSLSEPQIDSVVENASFQIMKNNMMCNWPPYTNRYVEKLKGHMLRKGICEDWRNHLTLDQAEHFDRVYEEKMQNVKSVAFPWG